MSSQGSHEFKGGTVKRGHGGTHEVTGDETRSVMAVTRET